MKEAMLSYYRQNVALGVALGIEPSEAMSLRVVPVRTLIMMGLEDGCMDVKFFENTFFEEDFPDGYEIKRIEKAGHFMNLDAPDEVTHALLDWFEK